MDEDVTWQPLRDALRRLSDRRHPVSLWLRDDDATEPTDALDQLLSLTATHGIPLSLAVIPASTDAPLADRLGTEDHVCVTVHGWSHQNHAPAERKKQELGADRPAAMVLGELRDGFSKLQALYPQQFVPVLVPPWNRIDAALLPALPDIGFLAVSVYGKAKAQSPVDLVNTHVDIMDWHGTGGCLPHGQLVATLVAELDDRMTTGSDEPIGILAHHLVHDSSAWDFLARLFEESRSPAVRWLPLGDLLD